MRAGPIKVAFQDFWSHFNVQESFLYRLLRSKFGVVLSEDPDFVIYSVFGREHMWSGVFDQAQLLRGRPVRILWTCENVRPNFTKCDYALSFDYSEDLRTIRWPLYATLLCDLEKAPGQCLVRDRNQDLGTLIDSKIRFCDFIYSNQQAARQRLDFFNLLSSYKRVDAGGMTANNIGRLVGDKKGFQEGSKFSIAFENWSSCGYVTEKILDPFMARSVPIYWGSPRIAEDFNPRSFVNCHDFADTQGRIDWKAVVDKVAEIDQDDALYASYLREPCFHGNRPSAYCSPDYLVPFFEKVFA